MSKRRIKHIFKQVRNANKKYALIENGDHIAAGISGGKDSLTMLYFLHLLHKYTPLEFKVFPIYLDLGWEVDIKAIKGFCESLHYNLSVEYTNIGKVVFETRREKNPCSLCARLRRGALTRRAKSMGCNKIALGHHLDDAVITLFLSMLFEGRHNVFKPRTYLDRMDITLIRPMIYVKETDILLFARDYGIPKINNPCPAEGHTQRDEVKLLINDIEKRFPGAKDKFLASMENVGPGTFWT